MFELLVRLICNYVEVEPENIHPESRFMEDLGFTSFDFMSMLGELEDELDGEAMMETEHLHKEHFRKMLDALRKDYPDMLPLGAGCCTQCKACTYPDAPCRFPEKQISSMESYGMLVTEVCRANHMEYYYGPCSIAYTSCFLLR